MESNGGSWFGICLDEAGMAGRLGGGLYAIDGVGSHVESMLFKACGIALLRRRKPGSIRALDAANYTVFRERLQ